MGLRSQSISSVRVNHPVAASNYFVTASGARQSITAHLDDGWPRCARHDGLGFHNRLDKKPYALGK